MRESGGVGAAPLTAEAAAADVEEDGAEAVARGGGCGCRGTGGLRGTTARVGVCCE